MTSAFKIWTTNRHILSGFISNYSLEQLNTMPKGFTNNLIWNIGHIIVTQQRLIYKTSGLPMYITDALLETYKTGTKPTGKTTKEEAKELQELLTSLISPTQNDFMNGKFKSFTEVTTSTGFNLTSTPEAIDFNNYHEGLHLGFMINIRKFL
jgi:hypothetical protein